MKKSEQARSAALAMASLGLTLFCLPGAIFYPIIVSAQEPAQSSQQAQAQEQSRPDSSEQAQEQSRPDSSTQAQEQVAPTPRITPPTPLDWSKYSKDPNERYTVIEDGELTKKIGIPTYEFLPKGFDRKPQRLILFVHGLTLHGGRYKITGKVFAAYNHYAVSYDMRGFGKCYYDPDNRFNSGEDKKKKVNYQKSFEDLVKLAQAMRAKYPGIPLVIIGESLGATPCLHLAAEHPDLVDGIVISAPAVKVNPRMFLSPGSLAAGLQGIIINPKFNVNLNFFMKQLVSSDKRVVDDMLNDPLMRHSLTIAELLETQEYVGKNRKFAAKMRNDLPILILQGRKDKCVISRDVTELANSIKSDDQTLRWFSSMSHLLLETKFFKAEVIDSISDWFTNRQATQLEELKALRQEMKELGAEEL
ncbi:MAG: lysophospholipase [Candidatus Obscuribacterales bacterium]|nr:lysophospholipase [Candidatus Obscuribacterales bacterium]